MIVANKTPALDARGMMAYLIDKDRSVAPRVLVGDRDYICEMWDIDTQVRPDRLQDNRAVMSVISCRPNETLTEEQKLKAIDDFVKSQATNMDTRVPYIAIEHNEKDHYHIHIYFIKMDSHTLKAYNPFPPGHHEKLKNFSAVKNAELGFEQVEKTRLSRYERDDKINLEKNGFNRIGKRKELDKALQRLVKLGKIKDRPALLHHLREQGYSIPRIGEDYITLQLEDGNKIRFKGGIYSEAVSYDKLLTPQKEKIDIHKKISEVNKSVSKTSNYNKARYGADDAKKVFTRLKDRQPDGSRLNGSTRHAKQEPQQHKDASVKTSQNASVQATLQDNERQENDLADFSPGTTGTETASAMISLGFARMALANARTPSQQARALQQIAAAQAQLEQILARLEQHKKKLKI